MGCLYYYRGASSDKDTLYFINYNNLYLKEPRYGASLLLQGR